MSKYQRVIRAELNSPNAVDNKSGQILDGRMLVIGSVGADKISVRELSDLIKAMGTLTTGTIHLGQANRSYIRLSAADDNPPRFELRDPQGRYVVVFDANPIDGVTAALGVPDANGVHPLRIPADTGDIEIRTRAIVGMNETARTFLDAGRIDLLASGTDTWDDVDATGIRLEADWGIASKEAGVQNVKWDAETGKLAFGSDGQVVVSAQGMWFDLSTGAFTDLRWYRSSGLVYGDYQGRVGTEIYPSDKSTMTTLEASGFGNLYKEAAVLLTATAASGTAATIELVSHADSYSAGIYMNPGIYLTPPSGYGVTVSSDMYVAGGLTCGGTLTGGRYSGALTLPYNVSEPIPFAIEAGEIYLAEIGGEMRLYSKRSDGTLVYWKETTP